MPAKSKAQQAAAGLALAAKRGEVPVAMLTGAARQMYESMTVKQLRHYAKTKKEGLPKRVKRKHF